MQSPLSYELLINLKKIDIISIRQGSFFQIRVTVMQSNTTPQGQTHHFAVPVLMLKPEPQTRVRSLRGNYDPTNTSEIDENNSFLSRKFIIRSTDEEVAINELCLFKSTLALSSDGKINKQIRIYIELIAYQQSDAEIVTEWEGNTFGVVGASFLPVYFNSIKCTCNLNATVHTVASGLSLERILCDGHAVSRQLNQFGNQQFLKIHSEPLQQTIELLKKELSIIHLKTDDIEELVDVRTDAQTYRYALFRRQTFKFNLQSQQKIKLGQQLDKMNAADFLSSFKAYITRLNQISYQLWKRLQLSLLNHSNEYYESQIRKDYAEKLMDYHRQTAFFLDDSEKPMHTGQKNRLFVYAFEKHETFIKTTKESFEMIFSRKPSIRKQVVVFVHGYQASFFDMEPLCNYLKYKYSNVIPLLSNVNEGRTEQDIEESAHRLAIEVKNFLNSIQIKEYEVSFVCHSLGGLIARAALKYLQSHKNRVNHFVSICSPHLGYLYHSSALISTSLWILNKIRKDKSMIQLTMEDSEDTRKTFIYELSQRCELEWFKHIWFFGSKEDEYVPYWSAILQDKNFLIETQNAKMYRQMLDNLTKTIEHKIIRCELVFNQKSKDLSNFIGRTAHIKILNYIPGIELFASVFVP